MGLIASLVFMIIISEQFMLLLFGAKTLPAVPVLLLCQWFSWHPFGCCLGIIQKALFNSKRYPVIVLLESGVNSILRERRCGLFVDFGLWNYVCFDKSDDI
jgi:O-antigen/teichoic acid export membrane protein